MRSIFAVPLLFASASGQTYGGGIGKTTHAISGGSTTNATAALNWFVTRLPTTGPAPFGNQCVDSQFCPCGQVGRVNVETNQGGSGGSQGFGLHTVHTNGTSPRPVGSVEVEVLEGHMTTKFKAAAAAAGYDALLDYNTGFWVSDLDPYVEVFSDLPTLAIEWSDPNNGQTYYSLMVQVLESYLVLELMSAKQTKLPAARYSAPHPRFFFQTGETPQSVFGDLSGTGTDVKLPMLYAAKVGHYTSDVSRDQSYYADVLGANVVTSLTADGMQTLIVDFSNMAKSPNYAQLHLVQRPSTDASGSFGVADAEETMNKEHRSALTSDVCGWDQWMDFHIAVNTGGARTFGELLPKMAKAGYKYHVLAGAMGGNTLYAVTPNGLSIQMTGMGSGGYTPTDTPTGVDGLCGVGPSSCKKVQQSFFA